MEKLDSRNIFPFVFYFPAAAPISVSLQSREKEEHRKSCGIHYYIKIFVGEGENDIPHRRLVKHNPSYRYEVFYNPMYVNIISMRAGVWQN